MRILITGDWQSHTTNLDLSKKALDKELQIISKYGIDIHIDTGDSKEEYSPVAVSVANFQHYRAKHLAKKLGKENCFRLLGNHDRIGQHADDRNWLQLFSDHAICIDKASIFTRKGVKLAFLPFCKDAQTTLDYAGGLAKEDAKLLFFHNEVASARFSNVHKLRSSSKITPELLCHSSYKHCFGGHIHKRQTIAGNIHYVGNPFPTDGGEVNQEKGFIVYDTKKDKITFVSSGLPCIYTYTYLEENKIKEVPDGSQIKHQVIIKASDDYFKKLDKINMRIATKYPNAIPYVVPDFIDEKVKEVSDIDPDASEVDQIRQYLDVTAKENERRASIEAYMNYVLLAVSKRMPYAKGLMFDKVVAHKILSWKDVEFSFHKRGLCCIRGINKDWKNHNNGAGKTNLLALIPVAHSGCTFKGQKFAELVHEKFADDKAWVRLYMHTKSGDKLEIYRQFNPSKLIFTVNGKDASQGLRSNGKKDTQGLIEEYTGYTSAMLANSVYVDQVMTQGFLHSTEKERAELLHKFQNLGRFTVAQKLVSKDISDVKHYIERTENTIDLYKTLVEETKDRLQELENVELKHLGKLKKNWLHIKGKLDLELSLSVKVQISFGKKIEAFSKELKSTKEKAELLDQHLALEQSIMDARKRELKVLLQATSKSTCSYCQQVVQKDHRKKLKQSLEKEINEISAKVEKIQAARKVEYNSCSKLEKQIDELSEQGQELKNKLVTLQEETNQAKALYKREKVAQPSHNSTKALKLRLIKLKKQLVNQQGLWNYYRQLLTIVQFAYHAFGREGLPLFLNKIICPRLNAAAKFYSELFVDKEIQVVFVIEDGKLIPRIMNAHGSKRLKGQSTGEKAWAGTIVSFALRDIAQPTNLLALDEPGAGLDSVGARQFGSRLPKLASKYETILVVTHNPIIESTLADKNSVVVVKSNGISSLRKD